MSNMGSLSREEQRVIGALKLSTDDSRAHGESTLIDTIHVSADQIEWLVIEGGDVFRDYTAKERRRMATEGRAMPDGSYPIADCLDAANAIHAVGRAKDPTATKAFIRRRVRALNCTGSVYENWK
jgi:hypothetical protein